MRNPNLRNSVLAVFFALLSSCSEHQEVLTAPLPTESSCHIDVTDASPFAGSAQLEIVQTESGATAISLVADARSIDEQGAFGFQCVLTSEQARDLAAGSELTLDSSTFIRYAIAGREIVRPILGVQMALSAGAATATIQLGEGSSPFGGDYAPAATATIRGQITVSCNVNGGDGTLVADPMFTTEFCAAARNQLELDSWIATLRRI